MGIWIDHIGIACEVNEVTKRFWELVGFTDSGSDENEEQGVKIDFMKGDVAPQPKDRIATTIGPDTPVGKFISKYGEGIQQLALGTDDIAGLITLLKENNVRMVNEEPTYGANNSLIAFVHPSSTGEFWSKLYKAIMKNQRKYQAS